ncbi:MAG: ATP-binding cassette domain-containing protein [Candidatus Delongbacteria bacterium]|nr:ATP-binding cassette domain-containing protein [Candidatus Delongbacteria bacterium]
MLQVNRITKNFHASNPVISNLSFEIVSEERVCLFAPSGSGKSVLLRILAGLDPHYQGQFHFDSSSLGVVFQEPALFWYKTIRENILYALRLQRKGIGPEEEKQMEEWLEVTGLKGYEAYYPYAVSGGMKQKASIIRCFLPSPRMVLLDEPFHSIDIRSKSRIIDHILRIQPAPTIVMTTHNLDEIPLLANRLLLFKSTPLSDYQSVGLSPDISLQALTALILK